MAARQPADNSRTDSLEWLRARLADRYVVERELVRGGMAVVYLAHDQRHHRLVAVKVLLPEIAALLGPERFLREIEITAQLQHPNIVPVHDSGSVEGTLYYVMPYIEGESLRARLSRGGRLDVDEALQIVREAGDALSYAHERGIIHRDVKPENILLSAGHAQIADFGIARAVGAAGGQTLTQTGVVVGTPAYMAPEQAAGLPDVDARADLYALAAVAHEALAGSRPDTLAAARTAEIVLTSKRADVSPALARALSAPLALERELRPASVSEWLRMVDRARGRASSSVRLWGTLAAVALLAVATGWWVRSLTVTRSVEGGVRQIALQLDVAGPAVLTEQALRDAFEQQLLYLPGAELVTDTAAASELLRARADLAADGTVGLVVQVVRRVGRAVVEQATERGSSADLPALVAAVLTQVYSGQIAKQEIGWSQALPRHTDTWRDYVRGERLLRSGGYGEAIQQFDRVIAIEPSYGPARFKHMLAELLRSRPTRAFSQVRAALDAARMYGDSLDATTRDLLRGYDTLIRGGDLAGALQIFESIVESHPDASDGWFVLGFLKVNFAGLLGEPPAAARLDFQRAYALDSAFAAVLAQLARIAYLQDDPSLARSYTERYLDLDSTSATAEVLRVGDSASAGSVAERLRLVRSLELRPAAVLEYVALQAGAVGQSYQDRFGSHAALDVLERRATTEDDRRIAFRMRMALHLGTGRYASADSALRRAAAAGVPADEIDAWLVLPAVTIGHVARPEAELDTAAARLTRRTDDPTAQWLAARWLEGRTPASYQVAIARLASLVAPGGDTMPLARGLLFDLQARVMLTDGDTTGALERWRVGLQRFSIGDVMFGLVGSLWPLRLGRASVALAAGNAPAAVTEARHFRYPAGFVDQVGWPAIWPLAALASIAAGDPLGAAEIGALLEPVLRDANGAGVAVRDSLRALAGLRR